MPMYLSLAALTCHAWVSPIISMSIRHAQVLLTINVEMSCLGSSHWQYQGILLTS